MSAAEQLEAPTSALATVIQPLEPSKAAIVLAAFSAMIFQVESWQTEAASLVVTSEDQTATMKRARLLRLEVKEARVKLEKKRRAMKEGIILEGRAIDGAFAIFESFAKPIEEHLLEQEKFAERAEAGRKEALRFARHQALLALDVSTAAISPALAEMTEAAFQSVVEDAKAARDARLEEARIAEEARVEAARLVAEREVTRKAEAAKAEAERRAREEAQRVENERLRAEAAVREAELAKERSEREAAEKAAADREAAAQRTAKAELDKLRAESAARDQAAMVAKDAAERRAGELQQKEAARIAAEAETKKPTKAKYAAMVQALTDIARWGTDLDKLQSELSKDVALARRTLIQIGESPAH